MSIKWTSIAKAVMVYLIATVLDGTLKKNLKKKLVVHQNDTEATVAQFNVVHYCKALKMMSSDLHDFQLKTFSVCA